MPLYKIECNIAMGFFFCNDISRTSPKTSKDFIGYSVKIAPTILTEEKQNLYQTCLFQISRIRKSLKLVGICVLMWNDVCLHISTSHEIIR